MGSRKRQLTLPGLAAAAALPLKRARRDYTAAEFARALERNGFAAIAGGACFADTTGQLGGVLHGIYRHNPLRVARRATLARIIRAREAGP